MRDEPALVIAPPDLRIVSVADLSEDLRDELDGEGEYVLSRPGSRRHARLVSRQVVGFIEGFRRPSTVVDATRRFAEATGAPFDSLLPGAQTLTTQLLSADLLVAADAASEDPWALHPGDRVSIFEVVRPIQQLADVHVYSVVGRYRERAALKITASPTDVAASDALAREHRVLRTLDGADIAPGVVTAGRLAGRPYVVLEWIDGATLLRAAEALRSRPVTGRARLFQLSRGLVAAYERLHAEGMLHGDVHPGNVLVRPDGTVRLVDFAYARRLAAADARDPCRVWTEPYLEPELAAALLTRQPLPPASVSGELYCVAALVYAVLAGQSHLDVPALKQAALEKLMLAEARPLAEVVPTVPATSRVLARALAATPRDRMRTMSALAQAFRSTMDEDLGPEAAALRAPPRASERRALRELLLTRYAGSRLATTDASLHSGLAGTAYALLAFARLWGDPELLALAELASVQAVALLAREKHAAAHAIDGRAFEPISLHHASCGVWLVRALIAAAHDDQPAADTAVANFVADSMRPWRMLDLTSGRAGTLLGCGLLLREIPDLAPSVGARLARLGTSTAAEILARLESLAPIGVERDADWLGIAHGWGGIAYAMVAWSTASGTAVPEQVVERLNELAALARWYKPRCRWPISTFNWRSAEEPARGWCHGGAGHALLWDAVDRANLAGSFDARQLASGALYDALVPDRLENLCCGRAGQAAALAYAGRGVAGAPPAARRFADAELDLSGDMADSLYKGRLGTLLVAAEAKAGCPAGVPLFS